jgi:hypothetical protein
MCVCLCVGNAHYQRADRQLVSTLKLIATALMICLSLKQTCYQVTAAQSADVPEFMLRLNFGLALIKRHKVCAVEGFVVHNFHLKLPELRATETDRFPTRRNLTSTCAAEVNCMRMYALARSVASMSNSMRQVVINLLNKTETLIPTFDPAKTPNRIRVPKAAIGILGDFLHWLAGVSTESDIQEIHHVIDKIKKGTELATAEMLRTKQGFLTASTLINDRLQKMHSILEEEVRQVHTIHQQVTSQQLTASVEMNAITFISNEISRFVQVYSDLFNFELAVESLAHKTLSPSLIGPSQTKTLLENITRAFEGTPRRLCYTVPHQIYASKEFQVVRHDRHVLIRIKIPYSTTQPLTVYELKTFESAVSGKQNFKTQLQQMPRYIVVNLAHKLLAAVPHNPEADLILFDQLQWQTSESCLYALVFDLPQRVPQVCEFSMIRAPIQPSVYRLTTGKYVVSNFSTVETHCGEESEIIKNYHPNCSLCLLDLPCGCSLFYDNRKTAVEPHGCSNATTTSSVLYPVNLAILMAFYNLTDQEIEGKHLMTFDELKTPQDIHWKIFAEKANQTLAADKELGYSLQKLIQITQNETDAHIFHSSAEALLSEIWENRDSQTLSNSFDLFDWKTYIIFLPHFLIIPLAISMYRLNTRLNALALLLAAVQRAPVALSYQLKVNPESSVTTTTAATTNSSLTQWWKQVVNEVRLTDAVVAFSTILIIVLMLAVMTAIILKRVTARSSYIYLDALSAAGCVQIKLLKLPHARRTFKIIQTQERIEIQPRSYGLYGTVKISPEAIMINDAVTNQRIPVPIRFIVSANKARQLAAIMKEANPQLSLLAVHSHEAINCTKLNV